MPSFGLNADDFISGCREAHPFGVKSPVLTAYKTTSKYATTRHIAALYAVFLDGGTPELRVAERGRSTSLYNQCEPR